MPKHSLPSRIEQQQQQQQQPQQAYPPQYPSPEPGINPQEISFAHAYPAGEYDSPAPTGYQQQQPQQQKPKQGKPPADGQQPVQAQGGDLYGPSGVRLSGTNPLARPNKQSAPPRETPGVSSDLLGSVADVPAASAWAMGASALVSPELAELALACIPGLLGLAKEVPIVGPVAGVLLKFYKAFQGMQGNVEAFADLHKEVPPKPSPPLRSPPHPSFPFRPNPNPNPSSFRPRCRTQ